jgi:hypothetical protein
MKNRLLIAIIAVTIFPAILFGVDPSETWVSHTDCLKRIFPTVRVHEGKLFVRTPPKGVRLLYSINDGEKKLAGLDEEISVEKGQKLQVFERHLGIEILPLPAGDKSRFAVVVREDFRSFGKDLTIAAAAFDVAASEMIAVPEAEAKPTLNAVREKAANNSK